MVQAEWPGSPGPYEPELVVTVIPQEYGEHLAVAVETRADEDGYYVVGVAVRRHVLAGYTGQRTHVSPRDVQRLPLARMVTAALAFARVVVKPTGDEVVGGVQPGPAPVDTLVLDDGTTYATYYDVGHAGEWQEQGFEVAPAMVEAGRVLVPRGRPEQGRSVDFYRELARSYEAFELGEVAGQGDRPHQAGAGEHGPPMGPPDATRARLPRAVAPDKTES